jgi:hypothetical protein
MNEEVDYSVSEQQVRAILRRQPFEGKRTSLVARFLAHEVEERKWSFGALALHLRGYENTLSFR